MSRHSASFIRDLIVQVATFVASEMVRKQMGLNNPVGMRFWAKTLEFLQKSKMLSVGTGVLISRPQLVTKPINMVVGVVKNTLGFGPSKAVALVESGKLSRLNSKELRMVLSGLSEHPVIATILIVGGAAASTSILYVAIKSILTTIKIMIRDDDIRIKANARAMAELLTKKFAPIIPLMNTIQGGSDVVAFLEQRNAQKITRAQLVMLYNKHKDILILEESLKILNPDV